MSDNIKVVVKVRPLISREIEEKLSYQWRVKNNTLYQLDQNGKDLGQSFTFDKVYDKDTKTSDVYDDIAKPIVQAATAGINGTIFAYGQTSSGKTYTMTGTDGSPGIIPLAVINLFEIIKNVPDRDFLVRVSYIEIYNETVKDLLNVDKDNIKVHETLQGIKVDATEKVTSCPEEVLEAMKVGEANRQKGATNMNEQSSRSHSIFQITIESREHVEGEEKVGCVNVSQLNLVDLAGSERAGQTGATGIRFKEGTHINKSLSALALVIKQLSEDPNKYANYRDSKLTRILQNSLGGNAKTSIICAVTPAAVEETISTLQFANRAKAIKNKPEVNAVATDATMIQSLTKQMSKLQSQLESKKNLEQDNYKLQNKIANLQKLILNGFAQRRSMDLMSGIRRKLQQPRRITISTLHSIDDEPVVAIPKFCTPSLKYNPLSLATPADFVGVAPGGGKLASVPEEPARTPPPHTRRVSFIQLDDEVIQLDSDDESPLEDLQTCSPIHKCYGTSKTPPCISKKKLKEAEQNLKDLVEFTKREKMYTPSVVEYIEKLEQNSTVIAKLQDELEKSNKLSQERDKEVALLKTQIKKTEEDVKALNLTKVNLQTQCNNFTTKLTDWEVSYETLKNKARLREEELLSLLDEITVKNKKPDDMEKILSRTLDKEMHFMDISKDISLVNSDNEGSIVHTNDDDKEVSNDVDPDTQIQLSLSSQTIIGLEADIFSQKQNILSLENINKALQEKINSCEDKLANMRNENSLLKSTIDTLNFTIQGQKEHLVTAKNDIESYNNLIQELQIKEIQKQNFPNLNINDSILENMIANEEQFIANNENMKNIINSLKIALSMRNKEIDELKSTVKSMTESADYNTLKEQLANKTQNVITLNEEVDNLKKQLEENKQIVTKLEHEKNALKDIEQKLSKKLVNYENKNIELEKENIEKNISLEKVREENCALVRTLSDKYMSEQEMCDINKTLVKQIKEMTNTISDFEKNIREKDGLIHSLRKEETELKDYLNKAKAAALKTQLILGTLTGNMQEVPEIIDNFVNIFSALSDSMNTLETVANSVVTQKEKSEKNNVELKLVIEEQNTKYRSEIAALQEQINTISNGNSSSQGDSSTLTHKINQLNDELQITRKELNLKISESEADVHKFTENLKLCNEKIEALESEKKKLSQNLIKKENLVSNLTLRLEEIKNILNDKILEIKVSEESLNNTHQERNELLQSIFRKVTYFTNRFNIENDIRGELENDCNEIHDLIMKTLDKIGNHITFISSKNDDVDSEKVYECNEIIWAANQEITVLTKDNLALSEKVSKIETTNNELTLDVKRIQKENDTLKKELLDTQKIFQDLQIELKLKAEDLSVMEEKVRNWKEQFKNLDHVMKQQMFDLKIENERLKAQKRSEPEHKMITYEHKDKYDIYNLNSDVKIHPESKSFTEISSPPSLLTICCNQIIDFIQPKENESETTLASSNAAISIKSDKTYVVKCKCEFYTSELKAAREENSRMIDLLERMEAINRHLLEEQEAVRGELQLLVPPAQELQKKIINHKRNLSILVTMTNDENKSLKLQVKALQHHHSRFHNVCQRDIPDFKKQLRELMTLLKGDSSLADQQNASFQRYSLPGVLDSSSAAVPNFKNDSTLDGDMLMLDSNITLTTAADNTLAGHDQTCLDLTQFYNEASCQTNEINLMTDENINQMVILSQDNQMYERLNMLKDENDILRKLVDKCSHIKQMMSGSLSSLTSSHDDRNTDNEINVLYECIKCKKEFELEQAQENLRVQLDSLYQELSSIKLQKDEVEQKYNNLMLETPSTDILVKKLSSLEKDYFSKMDEICKLNSTINLKNQELKRLQDENDSLSNEVMEHISETDDLNKVLNNLKIKNSELIEICSRLEQSSKESKDLLECSECVAKEELIQALQKRLTNTHMKLNRSLSDTDTSSRYNKICTLQSELHAGREDCKELTEDVVTIKNHLERSNLTMDLDDSMGESNITFALQSNKCSMPDIQEEHLTDMYIMDKIDCFKYYIEKTGRNKENVNRNVKIVEVMKMLYEYLITKHGNEVENLTNKLKDYDESKNQLFMEYNKLVENHSKVTAELKEKDLNHTSVNNILTQIKNNINIMNKEITNDTSIDHTKVVSKYKDHFLKLLDSELGISSANIFESLIDSVVNKHQTELAGIIEKYTKLQEHMETVSKELNTVNENLAQMKNQLSTKENEYNLLKAQNEKIHEISSVLTLDIVKKDKELTEIINSGYTKLIELNVLNRESVDLTLPLNLNVNLLFEHLITVHKNCITPEIVKEKESLALEVKNSMKMLEEKQQEIELLRTRSEKLQEINNSVARDLADKENKIKSFKALQEDFKKIYESKVEENCANIGLITKLSEEVKLLKASIASKEQTLKELEMKISLQNQNKENDVKIAQMAEALKGLEYDVAHLKAINEVITKENNAYAAELLKSAEIIRQNSTEMDKMTADILVLRESVKENGIVIENLKVEAKNLMTQNMELSRKLEEKHKEHSQLETNMKTHEKTAEIQTRMIMRLEKQKNEDDTIISEKDKQIEELKQKIVALKKQCDSLLGDVKNDELELLKKTKETLEARVTELESLLEGYKSRQSIDAIADSSRRRRQSIHDSKRMFSEDKHVEDHNHAEAIFESRQKPDDLFMDVDEDISNRSTPIRLSKGRENLSHSRTDQSDKDEDQPSRPSSVVATRRRRQSIHDMHRSVLRHTPSPHGLEHSNRLLDDNNHSKHSDASTTGIDSEVSQLKDRLAACQQELEDLKDKYRELDEECETCAEYLRERDEQCVRLKKEKVALQATITELKEKQLSNTNPSQENAAKPSVSSVAVNTDEDWTNLHSVVVDRMSFDAEVEKNKKLTKTIEELRFKKQELKNTLAKMQKAFGKNGNRELESTKTELQTCKVELLQLRERYKELDEECETCAQYLREKEEQCRKLKEAKATLEAKLQEMQGNLSDMTRQSARKKRQSLHDQNRPRSSLDVKDASTETSEDFLSYQVERDGSYRPISESMQAKEIKQLKLLVEKLSQQKVVMEQQLISMTAAVHAPHPMYVATGSAIVQNQQLTDVMKENQKLKKLNAKLVTICKKRGKDSNRENQDPADQG